MKVIACIPARYASTRFPGKVLADKTGQYLVQHTYQQILKATLPEDIIIAADDERILQAAKTFGARCVLTSTSHQSGTDRIAQAVQQIDTDIVINVQADEPEINPEHIDRVAKLLIDNPDCPVSTLATPFDDIKQIKNPNLVKVVTDTNHRALYFSRSPIPYQRDQQGSSDYSIYLRHLGIYAYRKDFLLELTNFTQTPLEKSEKLEQLRILENNHKIILGKVKAPAQGIDTPEQYEQFVKRITDKNKD